MRFGPLLKRIGLVFALLIVVSGALIAALLGTGAGRNFSAQTLAGFLSNDQQQIEISELRSVLGGRLALDRITLRDKDGTFAVLDNIDVRYDSWGFLSGDLRVESVNIERVQLDRLPTSDVSASPSAPSLPQQLLPAPLQSVDVQTIQIDRIEIGEAIAGDDKAFSLAGELGLINKPLQTSGKIEVAEIGENETTLSANWEIAPETDRFDLALDFQEEKGGLAGHLLQIPNRPKLNVQLAGGGPLSDWQSRLNIQFDDRVVTNGAVTLGLVGDRQRINAELKGQLAPLLPKSLLPLVAGETDLLIVAERNDAGDIFIEQAELNSALAAARVVGKYQPSDGLVDLSGEARIGDLEQIITFARQEGVATKLGQTSISGTLKGPLVDAQLALEGAIAAFEEGEVSLENVTFSALGQSVNIADQSGSVEFRLDGDAVKIGQAEVDRLLSGPVSVAGVATRDGDVIAIKETKVRSSNLDGRIAVDYDLARGAGSLLVNSEIESLGNNAIGQVFGLDKAQLQVDAEFAQAEFKINQANINSKNLTAKLAGQLDASALSIEGDVRFADLSFFHRDAAGGLQAQAQIGGTLVDPTILLTANGQEVTLSGKPIENPKLKISGSLLSQLALELSGQYAGAPIEGNAVYAVAGNGQRSLSDLSVVAPGTIAKGNLLLTDNGLFEGAIDFDVSDLSALGELVLQPTLSGAVSGKVALAARDQKQFLAVDARAAQFGFGENGAQNLEIVGTVENLFGALTPEIAVSAQTLTVAGERFGDINANISANENRWPVTARASYAGKPIEFTGVAQQTEDGFALDIGRLVANYKGIDASLAQTANIRIADGVIELDVPRVNVAGGTASVDGTITDQLNLDVRLNGLSASAIDQIAQTGQGLSGSISGEARVRGTTVNPNVSFSVNGSSLSVATARNAGLAALQLNGNGTYQNNAVQGRFNFGGGGLSLSVNGGVNLQANSINLDMSGDAPFAYFAQMLTRSGVVLSGNGKINASVSGTLSSPNFSGTLVTEDARFTEIASRLRVANIGATIRLNGDRAEISRLTGRLGRQGQVNASGTISLRPGDKLNADLNVSVRNGEYDDGNLISAAFDADLSLTGPLAENGNLRGQIALSRTDITVPETLANVVSPVAVTHKNASAEVNAQANAIQAGANGGSGPAMNLDVRVSAPNRIFVRGRGLDAELGGEFTISGTTARPIATGALNLIRGRMSILTKRFDFDFGRLVFTGPLVPSLDFAASTRDNGTTYTIFVRGEATSPEFSFGATPSVPEDQVVAKLFFGRNLADLSPLQLVQLANAVAELNGSNSGPGLLDRLRSVAGVDDVDIKTNEQGETTVGVGAYLNDRTYVNVEKGAGAGSGKVTIDLNITDNITARGETSEDGNTKAGVFFQQDY
jgi:translocation and assembly module TamB